MLAGFRDPTKDPLPGMVLKGIRRTHGVVQRRALPLDPRRLRQAWNIFSSLRSTRDKALVLLGFSTAFRRSELVGLDIDDLCWSERGLTIRLRNSKTDQERASRLVAVPWAGAGPCAALAVMHWIEASKIKQGGLFRSINAQGTLGERLSAQSVNGIVKTLVSLEGMPVDRISAHSLRAGFVTAAVDAGVDLASIQKQTGHASLDALARYIRGVDPFVQNANAKIGSSGHFN
ncbi:site-specific integrase [Lysobacter sp. A3-1-A15]|uniref:site-specific integrase n=1 Tax=Novilysobacter viscosus TaxID=3098602 RepID=UPI002ED908E1